jgi:carbon storage regulator
MLVLTRRLGEEIVIDGDIRVKVVLIKGDKVRLGITAPEYVAVDRSEVHERRAEFEPQPAWASTHPPLRQATVRRNRVSPHVRLSS